MKNVRMFALTLSACLTQTLCFAQAFQNLNFEEGALPSPTTQFVDVTTALPGWSISFSNGDYGLLYDTSTLSSGCITIFDALANDGFGGAVSFPAPLEGEYSVMLKSAYWQPGYEPLGGHEPAISQTGLIPSYAQSLTYLASGSVPTVSVDGLVIPSVSIGSVGQATQYALPLSAHSGNIAEIRFKTLGWVFLDDIQFSTVVVPEPTTFALLGLGSLALLMVRRRG